VVEWLKNILNKCLISENVYKNNLSFFKNLSLNTDFRIDTQSNIELPFEFRQLFSNENIDVTNFPANWPEHGGWERDLSWTLGEKDHKICYLELKGDDLAKFIAYFTHLTSDTISYAACKLEARLKKALKDGTFWEFCGQELFGSGPPSHKGRIGSIRIKKVTLLKKYQFFVLF
jgi:hypothetical protein